MPLNARSTKVSQSSLFQAMEETIQVSSSSFTHHPLLSCFVTLYTLFLLYFPFDLLRLSPLLLLSSALLLFLLRLGSTREPTTRPEKTESVNLEEAEKSMEVSVDDHSSDTKIDFVEWNLRAPLEVIHESHEDDDEEEEENPSVTGENDPTRFREIERFPSLSLCYPESDSDSSSEFNFPEMGHWNLPERRWEEEEEEEEEEDDGIGLIEIKLDHHDKIRNKWDQTEFDFQAEEDGLIEIDLFP